jgi:hypothetical protein
MGLDIGLIALIDRVAGLQPSLAAVLDFAAAHRAPNLAGFLND